MENRILLAAIVLGLLSASLLSAQQGSDITKPLLLVYSQGQPAYGQELADILSQDPRIDARILVLTDPDLFRSMLYFPSVKVVLAAFNRDEDEQLGEHLERFFEGGGGMVGLGFAGWQTTVREASETVFPLNASYYVVGQYNASGKAYMHHLYVDQAHPISQEVGNLTAYTHKVFMSFNKTSSQLLPVSPEGEVTVLYREPVYGAPAVVAYDAAGVSVTFGCFAGDSVERAPTYFGRFTGQEEFRKLLRNSIAWVWANERRYEETKSSALTQFAKDAEEAEEIRVQAGRSEQERQNMRWLRTAVTFVLAIVGVAVVYWKCLAPSPKGETIDERADGG